MRRALRLVSPLALLLAAGCDSPTDAKLGGQTGSHIDAAGHVYEVVSGG